MGKEDQRTWGRFMVRLEKSAAFFMEPDFCSGEPSHGSTLVRSIEDRHKCHLPLNVILDLI